MTLARSATTYIACYLILLSLCCHKLAHAESDTNIDPNNQQNTKQKQPPASSSAPAPSEMDQKVHAAIRKAAELTEKTEEKVKRKQK